MKNLKCKILALSMGAIMFLGGQSYAQVPSYVPTNGLVGWWPFNGNANDESGNGNNGTVNGATLTADRFGNTNKAYYFDGNSLVNILNNTTLNIQPSSGFSVSIWAERTNSSLTGHLFGKRNDCFSNTFQYQMGFDLSVSAFGWGGMNGASNSYVEYLPQFSINQWINFIGTFNGSQWKIYQNGMLMDSLIAPMQPPVSSDLLIGGSGTCVKFTGNIDDIGIWNRALSECEIQDLYNSQINSVTGSITVSPNSATIGSNVTLSTSSNAINVQWQSNPSNYGWQNVPANSTYIGDATNTLTVNNVQLANHNQPFRVIASNGNCTDTSNIATIQIADTCITNVTVYDTILTTVTDTLIINTTLSLPAPNNENTILIYPNPASDHITIDNGNFAAMAGYSIKITNNAGQQVFQSAINQAQFYVDLSTWTGNGLYFVHLIDPQNNTVTVRKIVLQ